MFVGMTRPCGTQYVGIRFPENFDLGCLRGCGGESPGIALVAQTDRLCLQKLGTVPPQHLAQKLVWSMRHIFAGSENILFCHQEIGTEY